MRMTRGAEMRYLLENEYIKIEVESLGAQQKSLVDKKSCQELLWEGNPDYWSEVSPLLFPFVGKCRKYEYSYCGKSYPMIQHGFAKDMEFQLEYQGKDRLILYIEDTPETYENYPFHFRLEVEYGLEERSVLVEWRVHNRGKEIMPFSIGGHPGFICPTQADQAQGKNRTACSLRLIGAEGREQIEKLCVGDDGLLNGETSVLKLNQGILPVTEHLFDQDALLLCRQEITAIGICDSSGQEYVRMESDTPVWGIWSMPDNGASYVCLENWFGVCDRFDYAGSLEERPLTNFVKPDEIWKKRYRIVLGEHR